VKNANSSDSGSSHVIGFTEDGDMQFIHSDDLLFLEDIGEALTTRASDVERNNETGHWEADMVKSGHDIKLTGFERRSDALAAEKKYLEDNVL
jgi:hypothetical protein